MADPGQLQISYASLPAIVFQCAGCRRIVGDSTELICTANCGNVRLVVLKAASGVEVDHCAVPSTELGFEGRYFAVCCTGCGSVVGRMHSAAPLTPQALLSSFCLDASRCTSYELGSSEVRVDQQQGGGERRGLGGPGVAATPSGSPPPPRSSPLAADMSLAADATFIELAARVELLQAELTRMQGMVLLHDSQLRHLPHYPPTTRKTPKACRARPSPTHPPQLAQIWGGMAAGSLATPAFPTACI